MPKPATLPSGAAIASKFRVVPNATISNLEAGASSAFVQGWLHRKPQKFNKSLTFAKIRDAQGKVMQLVDKNQPSLFKSLKPDSTVSVEVQQNGSDWECQSLKVLGAANLVPGELQAEKTKEWPPQYRYIQLRQPKFQEILRNRAKIIRECRAVLDSHGFTEIETPILFKSTPEGAREFLVPTRRRNKMYALPQSPQQYKQLLIASGIDKYYQVAKCFRDEDLRADRQPEFTQLDIEMGFVRSSDVQKVVFDVAKQAWSLMGRSLRTIDSNSMVVDAPEKFSKLTYAECIAKYGIDKPDLRSKTRILELKNIRATSHPLYPVLECMKVPGNLTEAPRVKYVTYENDEQLAQEIRSLGDADEALVRDALKSMKATYGLQVGDNLAFGDRQSFSYENPTPLGRVRQQVVASEQENSTSTTHESVAVWVEKFPSFEPLETRVDENGYPNYDTQQLKATHHPFTMVDLDDYHFLENGKPLKCHGMHFDLVIDGVEVGGGSQRVHDSELQRYILQEVLKVPDPDRLFGHLLAALATGCPPHAGLAIGLDRMIAMLSGVNSIRDVIAFPKTMTGTDPVVGSPSTATKDQLAEYHLTLVHK